MAGLARAGVSLESDLLIKFDRLIRGKEYTNRSEAIRDLIREDLIREEWKGGKTVAGAITMVYDHHKRALVNRLMDIQHDFGALIISTQHVHLDHHHCMEIVAVKGSSRKVQKLSDCLKAVKGVKSVSLSPAYATQAVH